MRRFVHATAFAVLLSAPVLTGALMDHSVVSVLGAPNTSGPCSGNCSVGGSALGGNGFENSDGKAEGGHLIHTFGGMAGTLTQSGTVATSDGATGRQVQIGRGGQVLTTQTGNFPKDNGHCTPSPC